MNYVIAGSIVYIAISPIYNYEIKKVWEWPTLRYAIALALIKGAHWGLTMAMNEFVGAILTSIVVSLFFYGIQEYLDLGIKKEPPPKNLVHLWARCIYAMSAVLDSTIELLCFNLFSQYTHIGLASLAAHTIGIVCTYPIVAAQRKRSTKWSGFGIYYLRSSIASFCIPTLAAAIGGGK